MIHHEGTLYRPPSEAQSLILQATLGCSYNLCTFCAMYREKSFRVRRLEDLKSEIAWAKKNLGTVRKVFLADGDALVAKARFLESLLDELNAAFPELRRVSVYASPQSLAVRTVEEMRRLAAKGLTLYYLGIESGDDQVLSDLEKGVDAAEMVRVANKAHEAGVKLSTMILLGAGGREASLRHARHSADVVNAIGPRFISTLVMTPVEGTPLWDKQQAGGVDELSPVELACELREFLDRLRVKGSVFRSNHASNYLALKGNLPKDQEALVGYLEGVIARPGEAHFAPEWIRGL
ncbi:MAG: radical SAM protein [Planctomycetes bacterium]|nr:radical SAM protein [Planctomycetota bacterium]HJM58245.1 radical SAM protein [Planctomycetota bacterium]